MATPIVYFDTGGASTNSGSSDSNSAIVSSASSGRTASVTGTTVTFSGAVDLSGVAADGSQTIYIADATNSNQKIFRVTAVNDAADTVTVDVAPTGTISASAWAIGGRMVYTPANWEGAAAPGWIFQFNNSPASVSGAAFLTRRVAGTAAAGYITVRGKTGVRPVLNVTDTNSVIAGTSLGWHFENLELDQDGASGNVVGAAQNTRFYNVKISDGGGNGFNIANVGNQEVIACEITGVTGDAIDATTTSGATIAGNYIHDTSAKGFDFVGSGSGQNWFILHNILDSCADRGIHQSAAVSTGQFPYLSIQGNTIYGCGNSGLEIADVDGGCVLLMNNIFMNNGNAAGEYNVEHAGTFELIGFHRNNLFYQDGTTLATGAANLSGLTANSSESTSDPLFVDAPNGDFRLQSGSPAKAAGFPGQFLGGPTGYLDMGAVQRQEPGSSECAFTFAA